MNLFAEKDWRHGYGEWTCDTVGEGESGTNGESSIDIYTLPCVKQISDEMLLYNTGSPAWHSGMT